MTVVTRFYALTTMVLFLGACGSDSNGETDAQPIFDQTQEDAVQADSTQDTAPLGDTNVKPDEDLRAEDLGQPEQVGTPDTETPDVEPDQGVELPDAVDLVEETSAPDTAEEVALGTKGAGESCVEFEECAEGMSCIGQYTQAHCNPMCTTTEDCLAVSPGTKPQCMAIGGYQICIWYCGAFGGGASCPGDLVCDGATCG